MDEHLFPTLDSLSASRREEPEFPTLDRLSSRAPTSQEEPEEGSEEGPGFFRQFMDAMEGTGVSAAEVIPNTISGVMEGAASMAERRFAPHGTPRSDSDEEVPDTRDSAVADALRDNPVNEFFSENRDDLAEYRREIQQRPGIGGDIGTIGGRLGAEVAATVGTGAGILKAAGLPAKGSGIMGIARRAIAASPIDFAIGASAPENSVAQMAAGLMVEGGKLSEEDAQKLAENAGARGILEVATMTLGDAALSAIGATYRTLRGARSADDAARGLPPAEDPVSGKLTRSIEDTPEELPTLSRLGPERQLPSAEPPRLGRSVPQDQPVARLTRSIEPERKAIPEKNPIITPPPGRGSEAGFARREVMEPIAGAGVGAATGAAVDEENRARGILIGGVAGAAAPRTMDELIRAVGDESGALFPRSIEFKKVPGEVSDGFNVRALTDKNEPIEMTGEVFREADGTQRAYVHKLGHEDVTVDDLAVRNYDGPMPNVGRSGLTRLQDKLREEFPDLMEIRFDRGGSGASRGKKVMRFDPESGRFRRVDPDEADEARREAFRPERPEDPFAVGGATDEEIQMMLDSGAHLDDFGLGEAGFASREMQALMTGTGVGAVAGGAVDDENPLRGAAVGAGIGLLGTAAARHLDEGVKASDNEAVQSVLDKVSKAPKKDGVVKTVKNFARDVNETVFDDVFPAQKLTNRVKEKLGKLPESLDFEGFQRASRSDAAYGERNFTHGVTGPGDTKPRSPALRDVIRSIGHRMSDFEAYAVARRVVNDLDPRGIDHPYMDEMDNLRETLREFDGDRELEEAFSKVQEIGHAWLRVLEENGVIRPGAADDIIEKNPNYIPFFRVVEGGGGGTTANKPIRAIEGSEHGDIISPVESLVRMNYVMSRAVFRQRAHNALAGIADVMPDNPIVTRLTETPDVSRAAAEGVTAGDDDIIDSMSDALVEASARQRRIKRSRSERVIHSFDESGNKVSYRIDDEAVWDLVSNGQFTSPSAVSRMIMGALRLPAKALRTLVTITPDFAVANLYRDMTLGATTSKHKGPAGKAMGNAVYDMIRGLSVVMTDLAPRGGQRAAGGAVLGGGAGAISDDDPLRGAAIGATVGAAGAAGAGPLARRFAGELGRTPEELMTEWVNSGGAMGAIQSMDRNAIRTSMNEAIAGGKSLKNVANPFQAMRALSISFENANRVGEFMRLMDDPNITKTRAAIGSRDVTTDFLRRGSSDAVGALRQIAAFWNARIQGLHKLGRVAKDDPKRAATVMGTTLVAPSMILYGINRDDPNYWETPVWERNLFWLIPKGDGEFIRVPKPFELGLIGASLPERMVEYFDPKNPERGSGAALAETAMENLFNSFTEMVFPMPTGAAPLWENAVNKDWTGIPVVSPYEEHSKLPDHLKGIENASDFAIGLGRRIGVSPAKIDNVIEGYTGRVGRELSELGDRLRSDIPAPKEEITESPILDRFFSRSPRYSPRSLNVMYDLLQQAEGARSAIRKEKEMGNIEEAQSLLDENMELLKRRDELNDAAEKISTLKDLVKKAEDHPDLSPEVKREKIDNILREIQSIAQEATGFDLPERSQ